MKIFIWMAALTTALAFAGLQLDSHQFVVAPLLLLVGVVAGLGWVGGVWREAADVWAGMGRAGLTAANSDATLQRELETIIQAAAMGPKDLRDRLSRCSHPLLTKIGSVVQLSFGETGLDELTAYLTSTRAAGLRGCQRAYGAILQVQRLVLLAGAFVGLAGFLIHFAYINAHGGFSLIQWVASASLGSVTLIIGVIRPLLDRLEAHTLRHEQHWAQIMGVIVPLAHGCSSHLVRKMATVDVSNGSDPRPNSRAA